MNKQNTPISQYFNQASQLVFGCMGLGGGWDQNPISKADIQTARIAIETALACNINVFDHADIYTFGKAERVFGEVLKQSPDLRQHMVLQSKCGIRFADDKGPKRYDFSADWITHSTNKSLHQLNIEQLDVLLLHRPDPLMQLDETAEVLTRLHAQGKFKQLGVSNMHAGQIQWLQSALAIPIVVNQIEMSLAHIGWLDDGVTTGTDQVTPHFDTGLLEYCQLNRLQLQAWGSLAQGRVCAEHAHASTREAAIFTTVAKLASEYQTSTESIALAWLMRLPMHIQPVIGTTNPQRIKACAQASSITLSREHWYALYEAARGTDVP